MHLYVLQFNTNFSLYMTYCIDYDLIIKQLIQFYIHFRVV